MASRPFFESDNGWMACPLCERRHESEEDARWCFDHHFVEYEEP